MKVIDILPLLEENEVYIVDQELNEIVTSYNGKDSIDPIFNETEVDYIEATARNTLMLYI